MKDYEIRETCQNGFTDTWRIRATNLTSAKRQASRLQVYNNTILSVHELDEDECFIVAEKGPINWVGSKWRTVEGA